MSDRLREFDPETGELTLDMALPPSANRLHRSAKFGVHPSPEYAAWLGIYADYLREILGEGWKPDTERWWTVWIDLHLGTAGGDADNRTKAVLDLLAGAYVTQRGETGPDGLPVAPGLVQRRGGLFDDDCRLRKVCVRVLRVNAKEPFLRVYAQPSEAPADERKELRELREAERAEKARAREAAKAARQATRAQKSPARPGRPEVGR